MEAAELRTVSPEKANVPGRANIGFADAWPVIETCERQINELADSAEEANELIADQF